MYKASLYHLLILANDGGQSHDDRGKGTLDVLIGVICQLLNTGHNLSQDGLCSVVLTKMLTEP